MADEFPSLGINATSDTITIKLPTQADTSLPRIPAELLDREVPSLVVEWIIESDEVGVLIQELLQAPTASLCRIFHVPTNASRDNLLDPKLSNLGGFAFGSPAIQAPAFRAPSPATRPEVSGFSGGPEIIEALPAGVQLPNRLLELCEIAARVQTWIEKGYRVRDWAEDEGFGDANWLPAAS
ncbi:MAG: hypothetical protein WC184_07320 [Acidimicrobiia bacterium]